MASSLTLTLLGVGAMNSPRFAPAGLLVERAPHRVMLDGGPGAEPGSPLDAWLVSDEQAELIREIRRLAAAKGLTPESRPFQASSLSVTPRPVRHTSHATVGFEIAAGSTRVVWAPEFWAFPLWATGADLMFADAAGWQQPIRFRGNVGGHAAALETCAQARASGVRRLVLAHIGRPTLRAIDRGERPPFGEFGTDGATYVLPTEP